MSDYKTETKPELHCAPLFLRYLLHLFYLFTSNVDKQEEIWIFPVSNTVFSAEDSLCHAHSPQLHLSKTSLASPESLRDHITDISVIPNKHNSIFQISFAHKASYKACVCLQVTYK